MKNKIRVGILGGGIKSAVGRAHIASLRLSGRFDVGEGYFSRREEENKRSHIEYGLEWKNSHPKNEYEWIEKTRNKYDTLIILTPSNKHLEHIRLGIKHEMNIIVEKPICCSTVETEELEMMLDKYEKNTFFIHNYSGYPMFREMCLRIGKNIIGEIHTINAIMLSDGFAREEITGRPQKWRQEDKDIPMIMLDLGTHLHHLIGWIINNTGGNIVGTKSRLVNNFGVIDDVKMTQITEKDIKIDYWISKALLGFKNKLRIEVYGTKGAIIWDQDEADYLTKIDISSDRTIINRGNIDNRLEYMNRFKAGHPNGFIDGFANYYYDIATEIEKGERTGWIKSINEAINGIKFLEEASTKLKYHER